MYNAGVPEQSSGGVLPELEGEEAPALDLCADKDACVLELDEAEDVRIYAFLTWRGHYGVPRYCDFFMYNFIVTIRVYLHGLKIAYLMLKTFEKTKCRIKINQFNNIKIYQ